MYLKEIETYGFKSFADKVNFEFTDSINGIVGPNGAGKSNVVDAVRWVLGEQSNKSLRMSDNVSVIFSGSKSRKPLNSAMVKIVFDNTDHHLPIDFSEVSIKRILYRTGDNEYYLNGEKCRLKDITELLIDSGAAKESFNIIGQGKVDEILATKPFDRRIIFEEAAGVLKYKKRKDEAFRKLERTNNNLARVNDIISELEINLEPLRLQSETAKKYLTCREQLTNYDISLMISDIDKYQNEDDILKTKITSIKDQVSELSKNNANYDVTILEYKNKLTTIEEQLMKSNQEIIELTKLTSHQDSNIQLFKERKKHLNIDDNTKKITGLKEEIILEKKEISHLIKDIEINSQKIEMTQKEIQNISKECQLNQDKLTQENQKISNNHREITNLKYQINYLEELITNGGNMPLSVKNLLHNPLFSGVYGPLSSLIVPCEKYSLAVSTAMGASANYLVVEDSPLATRMVEYLKKNKLGRATFLPLKVMQPRFLDKDTYHKITNFPGFISPLDQVLKYDSKYQNVILNQFGNVLLVDTLENAHRLSDLINHRYKIVTLDGQLVNIGGSITGGEKTKSQNLISQKYELLEYQRKLENLTHQNTEIVKNTENLTHQIKLLEDKIHTLNIDKINYEDLIEKKKTNQNNLNIKIKELTKELNDLEILLGNKKDDEEEKLFQEYCRLQKDLDQKTQDYEIMQINKNKEIEKLTQLEDMAKKSRYHISKLERLIKEYEVQESKLGIYIDNILSSLNEDYSITYSEAKNKYILDGNPEEIREKVAELKSSIKDYGMVNLGAIEEYNRVSSRYNFLTQQKLDLSQAEETLLKIIHDMDDIMQKRFIDTFYEIRQEFKKVFKELFKGGTADIYLTDPHNLLETGIELEATPPGKNLKNIQALSGGEKTLTAISLLFAILNVRPVPFCLFDEVEATLDDANVDLFGSYLDKYRHKTQFIIITHKKKTMEFIDTLYGITMQESGVSKKVSVKLKGLENPSTNP